MSLFVTVAYVCCKASTSVDVQDLELNRDGIICCDNCQSILMCRKAWDFLYKENK